MKSLLIICVTWLFLLGCQIKKSNLMTGDENFQITCDTVIPHWYIPDPKTALNIAKILWEPLYGEEIYSKQPFVVSLQDSIWVVKGTLPKNMDGGVPYMEIEGKNGTILIISHGK